MTSPSVSRRHAAPNSPGGAPRDQGVDHARPGGPAGVGQVLCRPWDTGRTSGSVSSRGRAARICFGLRNPREGEKAAPFLRNLARLPLTAIALRRKTRRFYRGWGLYTCPFNSRRAAERPVTLGPAGAIPHGSRAAGPSISRGG